MIVPLSSGPRCASDRRGALQYFGRHTRVTADDAENSAHPDSDSSGLRQSSYAKASTLISADPRGRVGPD